MCDQINIFHKKDLALHKFLLKPSLQDWSLDVFQDATRGVCKIQGTAVRDGIGLSRRVLNRVLTLTQATSTTNTSFNLRQLFQRRKSKSKRYDCCRN